jgi:hypothetical protein
MLRFVSGSFGHNPLLQTERIILRDMEVNSLLITWGAPIIEWRAPSNEYLRPCMPISVSTEAGSCRAAAP